MYVGESVGPWLAFVLWPDGPGRDLPIPQLPLTFRGLFNEFYRSPARFSRLRSHSDEYRFLLDQNKRASPYPIYVSFRFRYERPYIPTRNPTAREPDKRRHREINNARGNIVARYVSVRIPSLTLSIVLDLRGWSTPALNLSLTDGVIICIEDPLIYHLGFACSFRRTYIVEHRIIW